MTRAIAVLGTASDVGKSLIATALGRLLRDAGADAAPFKAQNMSLQAGVTAGGGEMSRAQILQAQACRVPPHVDMNPVLLKPVSARTAEVIVLGHARGTSAAGDYFRPENPLADVAAQALDRLAARHAVLVLEGAGSPVELNLMDRDFVNLRPARRVNAALVLVADIDRGGVFAQVKGTLDLLPEPDRARVLGVVVNRFRGDPALFDEGISLLERIAGCPVLAVVPWLAHGLDEEDRPLSLPVDAAPLAGKLNVGVVLHPHVANTDDVTPLLAEPDVAVTWVTGAAGIAGRDLIILPGSKATVADLQHHTASGLAGAVVHAAAEGVWTLGLCGGYQMLGGRLQDPLGTDGPAGEWPGLGLLPVETTFAAEKHLAATTFRSAWPAANHALDGYEIHRGHTGPDDRTDRDGDGTPVADGAEAEVGLTAGTAVGCYLHGLLQSDAWRRDFLNVVRRARGLPERPLARLVPLELRIDRWSRHVAAAFRGDAWLRIQRACGLAGDVP